MDAEMLVQLLESRAETVIETGNSNLMQVTFLQLDREKFKSILGEK
jgi:hypothetical protein